MLRTQERSASEIALILGLNVSTIQKIKTLKQSSVRDYFAKVGYLAVSSFDDEELRFLLDNVAFKKGSGKYVRK